MARDRLTGEALREAMEGVAEWTLAEDGNSIRRKFTFRDFNEAFGFMTRVALLAEKADHHPNWSNVWNSVHVRLTTHDVGGLSVLDFALARAIDRL